MMTQGGPRMQEGWERRSPHVELDAEALAAMIRLALPGGEIARAAPLSGGLANTNYKVTLAGRGGPVVLRLYTRDPAACARETALAHLAAPRIPVPHVLYAGCDAETPFAVTSWIEGRKLDALLTSGSDEEINSAAVAVGAGLAALGAFRFPQAGFFGPDLAVAEPFTAGAREVCLGYVEEALFARGAAERLGEERARRVWALLQSHAALLDAADGDPQLVHGDYKAQNLLVRPGPQGWELAAALDWEFAFASSPLFDLAILLRYAERLPRAFASGVIAGYTGAGRALPAAWRRITKLLDLTNLCDFAARAEPGGAMLADVAGLLDATLAGWEAS
jgi:aminoglycoside phosphotransferase (APT) family kinase protein